MSIKTTKQANDFSSLLKAIDNQYRELLFTNDALAAIVKELVKFVDIANNYEGDVFGVHGNDVMDVLSEARLFLQIKIDNKVKG